MIVARRIQCIALALAGLLLTGCGSNPPAPSDRFYRLQADVMEPLAPVRIDVRSVRADSLYAERPIVFVSADDPRQLRQYHYHLWLYPPAQSVREHMRASLGRVDVKAPLSAEVRITGFERVVDGKTSLARAALDISVSGTTGTLLEKRYQATRSAADDSFSSFTAAMEKALQQIYAELLRDIAQIQPTAR